MTRIPSPEEFLAAIASPELRKLAMQRADAQAVRTNQDFIANGPKSLPYYGDVVSTAAEIVRGSGGMAREAILAAAAATEIVCHDYLLANGRELAALKAFGF